MVLPAIKSKAESNGDYRLVSTEAELKSLAEELAAADLIAVDTETEGLEYEAIIVGICLSTRAGTGYYIPIRHTEWEGVLAPGQLPPPVVWEWIGHLLETKPCVGHNIKFDQQMLWKEGVHCNFVHDTLAIANLFGRYPRNGLKYLVKEEFGHTMAELDSLFPKVGNKKPEIRAATLSPEEICDYAVEDANWTLQLFWRLSSLFNLDSALYKIEMALLTVVGEMEAFGMPASINFLKSQGDICRQHAERLEREILNDIRITLEDPEYMVNFGSPAQLATLLYEHLKLPVQISKKTGNPSTDKDALAYLATLDPVASRIQTLRTMGKLQGTYLTGLLDKVHSDGRIRANFNQFGADTGRFTCSKPNLQQLPRTQTFFLWPADDQSLAQEFADPERFRQRDTGHWEYWDPAKDQWVITFEEIAQDERGKRCLAVASDGNTYALENGVFKQVWRCPTRNFVAASPGHYLIEADYSQIELRIMAGESAEPTLVDAYNSGQDVHTATAATIFGIKPEDVTDAQRQAGKTINFSLLYGAGADNVASQLGISKMEAEELIARYFQNLNRVGEWIESVKQDARQVRHATTNLGRVRYFPEIASSEKWIRAKKEREAVNFKIQGAAADVMKLALVRTSSRLKKYFGPDAKIVSTVHDSAVIEVADHIPIEVLMAVLKDAMMDGINVASFTRAWPDFVVDVKKGPAWASAKGVDWPEEELALPPLYEGELEKVMVRKVALERDLGLVSTPGTHQGPQDDIFTLLNADTEQHETSWVIELPHQLSSSQLTGLQEFLSARLSKDHPGSSLGSVRVIVPDGEGGTSDIDVPGKFALTVADQTSLRIKVGNCTLRQELDDIDPDEVLRGIDFGI